MRGVATTSRSGEMGSPQASRRLAPSPDALKKVLRGDEGAHTQCRMIVDERMMIDRLCGDASGQRGRNSPRERRVLVEREMRARVQVVREVVAEHWRQPRRVGDDDVVEALTSDRPDHTLGVWRREWDSNPR